MSVMIGQSKAGDMVAMLCSDKAETFNRQIPHYVLSSRNAIACRVIIIERDRSEESLTFSRSNRSCAGKQK